MGAARDSRAEPRMVTIMWLIVGGLGFIAGVILVAELVALLPRRKPRDWWRK